jgi:hypothetical protein
MLFIIPEPSKMPPISNERTGPLSRPVSNTESRVIDNLDEVAVNKSIHELASAIEEELWSISSKS